ncbi:unnamed protein product [Malus baccata var. baccata]
MAEELALDLEELGHLQSIVKRHHIYHQPPQPSFPTPSLFGKGAIIAATATIIFSINQGPPVQRVEVHRQASKCGEERRRQAREDE